MVSLRDQYPIVSSWYNGLLGQGNGPRFSIGKKV